MFNYLIQSYTPGRNMTRFDDDAFMNFAPDMKKHDLSDSGGSYLSRFNNDTSHIILTIGLESIINYKSIYLTVIIFDFMSYASPSISNLIHIFENTMVQSRKIFKERIIKAAYKFSHTFKYINMYIAMSDIDHHNDTTISSFNKPNERNTIELTKKTYRRKFDNYHDMHRRIFDMMDEYLENIDTPVVKKYEKLSDVPREPAWTFPQRYKNEARNHHYLNTNPIRIESWTADIARAHLALTDSADSSFILFVLLLTS